MKYLSLILLLGCINCNTPKPTTEKNKPNQSIEGMIEEKIIIYKTSTPSLNRVPITMINNQISSYPHQNDVQIDSMYKKPILLKENWYIDQIGVNQNTRFLLTSFEEYHKLKEITKDYLKNNVSDIKITQMYECPSNIAQETILQHFKENKETDFLSKKCIQILP